MKRLCLLVLILFSGAFLVVIQDSNSIAVHHQRDTHDTDSWPVKRSVGSDRVQSEIEIVWNITNVGPGNQTHPGVSYDSTRDQILLIWEDGRNDPQDRVDYYGIDYNSDIFGRVYGADGQAVGAEFPIATDGEHPSGSEHYDNEQWPTLHFDPGSGKHAISWMTLPDEVLEAGSLQTTTCYDINFRTYQATNDSLSGVIEDLAWYTAPPGLIDPWGAEYDWSCQHESVSTHLESGVSLVVWHDHRERYELDDGIGVNKDIYAQIIDEGDRLVEDSILITHAPGEKAKRLIRYQENPDIAGKNTQRLVVWEDERNSVTSNYVGYRDIYGRFINYVDGILTLGDELEIALGSEGETPSDYKLAAPRVGYMSALDAYAIVWEKKLNYTDSDNDSFQLMQAIIGGDGQFLQTPTHIPTTDSKVTHTHDIACSSNRCVLVYRKGENTKKMYASMMAGVGSFNHEIRLDGLNNHHTYSHLVAGQEQGTQTDFYISYVAGSSIHVARIKTTADPAPTPTTTPSSTLTPSVTPTSTPTSTPTYTSTHTATASPTRTPSTTPSATPIITPESRFILEVNIDPIHSGGSVSQYPSPDPDGKYARDSEVILVASPNEHYACLWRPYWSFESWRGDLEAPSPVVIISMDSDKEVEAVFQEFFPPTCTPLPSVNYLPMLFRSN